jgi:hypothetical protein
MKVKTRCFRSNDRMFAVKIARVREREREKSHERGLMTRLANGGS